jgi:hypothetical protein
VHLGGGVVQLRSRDGASRIAQRAASRLATTSESTRWRCGGW